MNTILLVAIVAVAVFLLFIGIVYFGGRAAIGSIVGGFLSDDHDVRERE